MTGFIPIFNQLVASLTLGGQVIIAIVLLSLLLRARGSGSVELIATHAMKFVLLISFGAVVVTTFYSDIIGFTPCTLCWWQRIFMYPIFFLSALALYKKDETIIDYLLLLSILGGLVAIQHIYVEYGGSSFLPCSAEVISCSVRFVYEYGYITIPVMSLTGFTMIGTVLGIKKFW